LPQPHPNTDINAVLTLRLHFRRMVTRRRLRSVLTALGLYVGVALLIGYFWANAYTGNHGLRAKLNLDLQIAQLTVEEAALKAERTTWERRVMLLKSESLDPDMLDERARALLDYADPRDLMLKLKR
jgi:cell division protein FtsB